MMHSSYFSSFSKYKKAIIYSNLFLHYYLKLLCSFHLYRRTGIRLAVTSPSTILDLPVLCRLLCRALSPSDSPSGSPTIFPSDDPTACPSDSQIGSLMSTPASPSASPRGYPLLFSSAEPTGFPTALLTACPSDYPD